MPAGRRGAIATAGRGSRRNSDAPAVVSVDCGPGGSCAGISGAATSLDGKATLTSEVGAATGVAGRMNMKATTPDHQSADEQQRPRVCGRGGVDDTGSDLGKSAWMNPVARFDMARHSSSTRRADPGQIRGGVHLRGCIGQSSSDLGEEPGQGVDIMSPLCASRSTRGSSTISASGPISATCCANSRGSIKTLSAMLLCREPDLGIAAQFGPNFRGVANPHLTTRCASRFTSRGCFDANGPMSTTRRTTCCRLPSDADLSSRFTTAST